MKKAVLTADITLTLSPSQWLLGWLGCFSILVLFSVLVSVHLFVAMCIITVYVCLLHRVYQHYFGPKRVRMLKVDRYGDCFLSGHTQTTISIQVLASSVVTPWCIVLHYRNASVLPMQTKVNGLTRLWHVVGECQTLMILPDQTDAITMAALRRWLRWGQTQANY